MNDLYINF